MPQITVDLFISADEWLKTYRGEARTVTAKSRDGRRVQFPASILQPYLTHAGVRGSFVIHFDDQGRFAGIDRLN